MIKTEQDWDELSQFLKVKKQKIPLSVSEIQNTPLDNYTSLPATVIDLDKIIGNRQWLILPGKLFPSI